MMKLPEREKNIIRGKVPWTKTVKRMRNTLKRRKILKRKLREVTNNTFYILNFKRLLGRRESKL